MKSHSIMLTETDYDRLDSLIEKKMSDPLSATEIENLAEELGHATIIPPLEVPPDLVTMHSRVQYLNYEDNTTAEVTIVYPAEADSARGLVSVMAPIGAALIGLREYEEIEWVFPDGRKKRLKVLEIVNRPE